VWPGLLDAVESVGHRRADPAGVGGAGLRFEDCADTERERAECDDRQPEHQRDADDM
jgi:hypothetical protein